MCVYVFSLLFSSPACVRVRVKGEKVPELLLELQDDDRSQTFLTQVKSAQEQGKTPPSAGHMMNYLITHLTFIQPAGLHRSLISCVLFLAGGNNKPAALSEIRSRPLQAESLKL